MATRVDKELDARGTCIIFCRPASIEDSQRPCCLARQRPTESQKEIIWDLLSHFFFLKVKNESTVTNMQVMRVTTRSPSAMISRISRIWAIKRWHTNGQALCPLFFDRIGGMEMLIFVEGGKPQNPFL